VAKVGVGISTGTGSDPQLVHEQEADLKLSQVHYAFEGRLLPIAVVHANASKCTFSRDNTANTDLVVLKPAGATHARLTTVAGGGGLFFWDNGLDPQVDPGWPIPAGQGYDFANLEDCSSILITADGGTAAQVRILWYKRK
jgi:hypothetical protein